MSFFPRHRIIPGGHHQFSLMFSRGSIDIAGIVGAICINLYNMAFNLVKQTLEDFTICPVGRGDFDADGILIGSINRKMYLNPTSPLAYAMLSYFPFTFAINLQPRRIDYNVQDFITRTAWNFDL